MEYTLTGDQQILLADCLTKTVLKDAPKSATADVSGSDGVTADPDGPSGEVKVVGSNKGILSKSTSKVMKFTTSMFKSKKAPEREQEVLDDEDGCADEDALKSSVPLLSETNDRVQLVAAKKYSAKALSEKEEDSSQDASTGIATSSSRTSASASAESGVVTVAAKTVVRAPEQSNTQTGSSAQSAEVGNYDNIMSTRYW